METKERLTVELKALESTLADISAVRLDHPYICPTLSSYIDRLVDDEEEAEHISLGLRKEVHEFLDGYGTVEGSLMNAHMATYGFSVAYEYEIRLMMGSITGKERTIFTVFREAILRVLIARRTAALAQLVEDASALKRDREHYERHAGYAPGEL